MKTSQNGIDLIKRFEGLRTKAYKCPAGVITIGYGHTNNVKKNDTCTKKQAVEYLKLDLEKFEYGIHDFISIELSQNQFDALVSFTFNIGLNAFQNSTMRKLINAGHPILAAEQFEYWVYAKGVKLEGLVKRRRAEKELFLTP